MDAHPPQGFGPLFAPGMDVVFGHHGQMHNHLTTRLQGLAGRFISGNGMMRNLTRLSGQAGLFVHQLLDAASQTLSLDGREIIAALQSNLNRVARRLGAQSINDLVVHSYSFCCILPTPAEYTIRRAI